jgi:hypothetical protein
MQSAFREPWTPRSGTGWDLGSTDAATAAARVFKFDNLSGAGELYFADEQNVRPSRHSGFNDWLAYDSEAPRGGGNWNLVGDLKLQFYYQRKSGEGPLQLRLAKRGKTFVAEIGKVTARLLVEEPNGETKELFGAKEFASHGGAPMLIEFTNADYRVTLRVNDVEIFRTIPEQYSPDIPALLATGNNAPQPGVSIVADKQQAAISHVSLWRDIYYLGDNRQFKATPDNIMHLNADEFFVLGDNSQISGDGRYWAEPVNLPYENLNVAAGKVPARFMLGKAFFVYWPAGYRPFESSNVPALVPNFGDMRFIH